MGQRRRAVEKESVAEYQSRGFVVFRSVFAADLIERLRVEAEKARDLLVDTAKLENRAQRKDRLQPIWDYDAAMDLAPFRELLRSEPMREARRTLLSHRHIPGQYLGILFQPELGVYCTPWHRDIRMYGKGFDEARFERLCARPKMFNQYNVPLFDDDSLWIAEGSANRGNSQAEIAYLGDIPAPNPLADPANNGREEIQRLMNYAEGMPGAIQLRLHAGDLVLYRAGSWHLGLCDSRRVRATLIDRFQCPRDVWYYRHIKELGGGA